MRRLTVISTDAARMGAALACVLVLSTSGCFGPAAIDSPNAGRTTAYEPGVPNFDMESIVRVDDDRPKIELHYSLPFASLVFVQAGDRYTSGYELVVQVVERATGALVSETSDGATLSVASFDSTQTFRPHIGRLELEAPAGDYVVEAVLTDLESGESARRSQAVRIAGLETGETYIGPILLEGRNEAGVVGPVISLHVPAEMDSLRASIQLYNLPGDDQLEVSMHLVRYRSDTTVAAPPYWLEPPRGSLAYRGIEFGEADTIQVTHRVLRGTGESALVEFQLPGLEPGIYRLGVTGRDSADIVLVDRERLVSVKNPTFPRMTLIEDLIDALIYIAFDNEVQAIREGETPDERKRRFDAFWGRLVPNKNRAANLLALYYGRIEEANLFFTGYKEGWMTDRGMIFTILGPPIYVDRRVDMEIWYYSYGDRDPANTYVFERVHQVGDEEPFSTYILQRRPYYQMEWGRAIDRWRDGEVL